MRGCFLRWLLGIKESVLGVTARAHMCVCVFQQDATWPCTLMALTFIVGVCCGILKWAEPPESGLRGLGFSRDGLLIPRDWKVLSRNWSWLPPRCAAEGVDYWPWHWKAQSFCRHTCSFYDVFFFSFLKNLLEYTAFQSLLDREWIHVRPFSHNPHWC